MMTALRAKGKEFDRVIILDANDGMWPDHHDPSPSGVEAERRLFYVAFTRARQKVLMIVSKQLRGRPAIQTPYIEELGPTK